MFLWRNKKKIILEEDLGEKVSLNWLTSPYLELREKWKCKEYIGKSKFGPELLPEFLKLPQNFSPIECSRIWPLNKELYRYSLVEKSAISGAILHVLIKWIWENLLTLVMLNKLTTSSFQPIRLLDPGCWYKFTYIMANSADPDQFRSQLIWIYTVCKGRVYTGSAWQGLIDWPEQTV